MSQRRSSLYRPNGYEDIPYDAWLKMEDVQTGAATTLVDESGNYDAVTSGGTRNTGQVGFGYDFTVGTSYIDCNSVFGFSALPVSLGFWINSPLTSANQWLFGTDTGTLSGMLVRLQSSGQLWVQLRDTSGNRDTFYYTTFLTASTWQSVQIVATSISDVKLYLDGVENVVSSVVNTGTLVAPVWSDDYRICRNGVSTSIACELDEIKAYSGAWTTNQINLMYTRENVGDNFTSLP